MHMSRIERKRRMTGEWENARMIRTKGEKEGEKGREGGG